MEKMTSRERVLAAINRTGPDQVPMDFGGTLMSLCLPDFLTAMRNELGFSMPEDRDEGDIWVDEQIQRYLKTDLRHVPTIPNLAYLKEHDPAGYLAKVADLSKKAEDRASIATHTVRTEFPMRDMELDEAKAYLDHLRKTDKPVIQHLDWVIDTAKEYRANGYATTIWGGGGPFEQGCWLRGYDQFCMDMIIEPEIATEIVKYVAEKNLRFLNDFAPALAPYIDIFCYGDDLATQKSAFMSVDMYREFIMPGHQAVYSRVHELAKDSYVFHHCCGSSYKLLPSLVEAGVNVSNPTQITAVDMSTDNLSQIDNLCFHGGIDLQEVLSHFTPEQVTAEANRVISAMNNNGGYICAACHSLPEDVSVENLLALFEADRTLGK